MKILYKPANLFFDRAIRQLARCQSVLEIGSGKHFGKELSPYMDLFRQSMYKTLDISEEIHPDIVDDICHSQLADASVDGIIAKSVLEHVVNPKAAVDEMYRILKPRGKFLGYVPFLHKYHGTQRYRDYYRFTIDAIELLFGAFTLLEVQAANGVLTSLTYSLPLVLPGKIVSFAERMDNLLQRLLPKVKNYTNSTGFYIYAEK